MSKSILFVGNHFRNRNGLRYIFDELSTQLIKDGWSTYYTSKYRNKILKLLDMLWSIFTMRNLYHVAEVDVFSGNAFLWAQLSTFLLHFLKKPTILTLHGGNLPIYAKKYPIRVKNTLGLATNVVSSVYLFEKMKKYRSEIKIIPNPIEITQYPFRVRTSAEPNLVWLRAFHEIYNPTLVPRVLHELISIWPEIKMTMVGPDKGDGSLEQMLEVADQLKVRQNIHLVGQVPRNHVPEWLNRSDIFINSTNIDNTPISVIEAMACGLCVVSTNVGGIPYIIDDGIDGLLVPPNDTYAMAESIKSIILNPSLSTKLSENARRRSESHSWEVIYPEWETIINDTIRKNETDI